MPFFPREGHKDIWLPIKSKVLQLKRRERISTLGLSAYQPWLGPWRQARKGATARLGR